MTEDEKTQRVIAEIRHKEIIDQLTKIADLLNVIAYPQKNNVDLNELIQTEGEQYKITDNEKSTD